MIKEDIQPRTLVRNKKYMTKEIIIGTCIMKDSKKGWINAVIYTGIDRKTNCPNIFTKSVEEFIQEFNLLEE